jgi:prepilin-type N-terminal cleavage/methylation domain-containing protein
MKNNGKFQHGFTLVEIAIVLMIVAILLGYTVALFPRQQELKQFRAADRETDEIIEAIIGFAQIYGRLPCPALPSSGGEEDGGGAAGCTFYGGFVPMRTLGLNGRVNGDNLMIDPWGGPYRYYVTNNDEDADGVSDFVETGEMRDIGIVDVIAPTGGGYLDLDGRYLICDDNGADVSNECNGANEVFGEFDDAGGEPDDRYGGASFVLLSLGKNWNEAPVADEMENRGNSRSLTDLLIPNGPMAVEYRMKNVAGGETTFVRRPTGFGDDFDDIVKWVSPSILYSKMIEAGQLP